ncbi:MAG: helix-turn-helix transcriptional regulator [Acidimicrobiia bacterium]|nr:helix-turn-helix transcriptional regulator [Acidimicrobiia bacterium]
MSVGSELRAARELRGMSIRKLAATADVAPSTVWRIETDRADPGASTVARLFGAVQFEPPPGHPTREELVSLALGRLTAAEVLRHPEAAIVRARGRLHRQLQDEATSRASRRWLAEWQAVVDRPLIAIVAVLLDPSQRGYEMRQHTPFAGLLSDEERLTAIRSIPGRSDERRSA